MGEDSIFGENADTFHYRIRTHSQSSKFTLVFERHLFQDEAHNRSRGVWTDTIKLRMYVNASCDGLRQDPMFKAQIPLLSNWDSESHLVESQRFGPRRGGEQEEDGCPIGMRQTCRPV